MFCRCYSLLPPVPGEEAPMRPGIRSWPGATTSWMPQESVTRNGMRRSTGMLYARPGRRSQTRVRRRSEVGEIPPCLEGGEASVASEARKTPSAYRPICLLDEAGKLLERVLVPASVTTWEPRPQIFRPPVWIQTAAFDGGRHFVGTVAVATGGRERRCERCGAPRHRKRV